MTIWLLAVFLFAVVGSSGYQQGALRMLITFFGAIVAAFLAVPLAPYVRPLVPMIGLDNPPNGTPPLLGWSITSAIWATPSG